MLETELDLLNSYAQAHKIKIRIVKRIHKNKKKIETHIAHV